MRALLNLLPVVGCASMMLICVRMMGGHRQTGSDDKQLAQSPDVSAELAELRAEVARLRDEQSRSEIEDPRG